MTSIRTETETVIKRILPYLRKRGYKPEADIDFETPVKTLDRYNKGYTDLLVNCGKETPLFLIEAKRNGKKLTSKDKDQALSYGAAVKVLFVVVTNGSEVQLFNTNTGAPLLFDGKLADKIPTVQQLPRVIRHLKTNKTAENISLEDDTSLPYRPGLPLKHLNALFSRCHNRIRDIEKNEEHAFADFSKILFLKLLEEKADRGEFVLPYSYRFYLLAERPVSEADQVRDAINKMLDAVKNAGYGDVLSDPLYLKKAETYRYLVSQLSLVSFDDSGLDTKGAAFEYFVRATLKGKKLGQYFTPRPLVDIMFGLVGRESIIGALRSGSSVKVLDPACGTGGFLVFSMKTVLLQLDALLDEKKLSQSAHDRIKNLAMRDTFYGADANEGVAASAKMNMIIAGDGHTNIKPEDSLQRGSTVWKFDVPEYDVILTNPPFGTSEGSSLTQDDSSAYPVSTTKGQLLFLQRMILATKAGGHICTVIDDGVLNTDTAADVRKWALQQVELVAVVQLPEDTFKPNKINVRSSVLLMKKRENADIDFASRHHVVFCRLESLGYTGTSEIRGFDLGKLKEQLEKDMLVTNGKERCGYKWRSFDVSFQSIAEDTTNRLDLKYWDPESRNRMYQLKQAGTPTLKEINCVETIRGKSPSAELYVDQADGFALVVKAGTNISKFGELILEDADFIEKTVYDETRDSAKVFDGDVLVSSTGDGTLGKVCVYNLDIPAIADGHVTIIRCDPSKVNPHFLADYLRCGFGKEQIDRLYSGSTGLIELTPEHVNRILIELPKTLDEQKRISTKLREKETAYREALVEAEDRLGKARRDFGGGIAANGLENEE